MTEEHIKKQLGKMLASHTPGSVLHILAGVFHEAAEDARQGDDAIMYEKCRNVERTLFVVGLGIDAACPR